MRLPPCRLVVRVYGAKVDQRVTSQEIQINEYHHH